MSQSHLSNIPLESFWTSELQVIGSHAGFASDKDNRSFDIEIPSKLIFVLTDIIVYPAAEFIEPSLCTVCEIYQIVENPYQKKLRFKNQVGRDVGNWSFSFTTGLVFDASKTDSDRYFIHVENAGLQAGFQLMGYFSEPKLSDVSDDVTDLIDGIKIDDKLMSKKPASPGSAQTKKPSRPARRSTVR